MTDVEKKKSDPRVVHGLAIVSEENGRATRAALRLARVRYIWGEGLDRQVAPAPLRELKYDQRSEETRVLSFSIAFTEGGVAKHELFQLLLVLQNNPVRVN